MGTPLVITAVAVVIPARDEADLIGACLQSVNVAIGKCRDRLAHIQTIVVADNCRDDTAGIAVAGGARVVRCGAGNVGAARRLGVEAAIAGHGFAGQELWLAFTDADTRVGPQWLQRQLAWAAGSARAERRIDGASPPVGADVVLGTVRPAPILARPDRLQRRFAQRYGQRCSGAHGHVHGANFGVRADAYTRAGGFGCEATGEDRALAARLSATGAAISYAEDIEVVTSGRLRSRVQGGFADHLRDLMAEEDHAPRPRCRDAGGAETAVAEPAP